MYRRTLLLAFCLVVAAPLCAQKLPNDRFIRFETPEDITSARTELIRYIWGSDTLPLDRMPRLPAILDDVSPVGNLTDVERVDTLIVDMEAGLKSYAHHFIPRIRNDRLVILHAGHVSHFNDSDELADEGFGMRRTLEGLLGDGYSVLAVYMPRNVKFGTSIVVFEDGGTAAHDEIFRNRQYIPSAGSQMKYFLEPITAYLNYLAARPVADNFPVYRDYSIVGFSGGGWAATVYPAIDTRIRLSMAVAGSLPLYMRAGATVGDAEQTDPHFYSIAGYPELYVMASDGPGRKQIQLLNRLDWCCFSEPHHDPTLVDGLSFDQAVREYETRVRATLLNLGNTDLFSAEIDEAAPGHNVTWDAIYDTILPELNEGKRIVGTAGGEEAVARGASGYPAVYLNGVWSPSKLSPMIGVPAILRGSLSIYDMFYRTASSQLVHVSRPPMIWSRAKLLAEDVLSDPAAASRGAGRYDVVFLGKDYRVYHIAAGPSGSTTEAISKHVKSIGQPTLIASPPDRLDLFFKSWNRQLYHARKTGNGPWIMEEVGGRMVDFPTAVRLEDGSFMAFVRGVDGGLWEARRPSQEKASWSSWSTVSGTAGGGSIKGSPSAVVRDGVVHVYARSIETGMLQFTFDKNWTVSHQPGAFLGSPTAAHRGSFVRGIGGSLFTYNGTTWADLGGQLD
jgi:hypothetical protein